MRDWAISAALEVAERTAGRVTAYLPARVIVAAVDLGTNTTRLLVGAVEDGRVEARDPRLAVQLLDAAVLDSADEKARRVRPEIYRGDDHARGR